MSDFRQTEALLQVFILIVPVLVLLVLISMLIARRRAKQQRLQNASAKQAGGPQVSIQETAAPMTLMEASSPARAEVCEEIVAIERQIAGAEAGGAHHTMAAMYLVLAARRRALGLEKEAQAALRSAAGVGAQYGPGHVHAAARIALAEAAFDHEDLTAACEQWQMARAAFQRDGKNAEADDVDKRMRANGCPTDWVLTDF